MCITAYASCYQPADEYRAGESILEIRRSAMTNEEIRSYFEAHAEEKFQKFTSGLIPGSDPILGVRIPVIRSLAKQIAKGDFRSYLADARDDSYEEIILQGFVIGYAKAELYGRSIYRKGIQGVEWTYTRGVLPQNGRGMGSCDCICKVPGGDTRIFVRQSSGRFYL